MPQGNVSLLQTAVPRPSQVKEKRLRKRQTSQQLRLTFLGADQEPVNWSLSGVLVADRHPHTAVGTIASGFLSIRGHNGRFRICVELVRRDKRTGEIAFRFVAPSRALLGALARIAD